MSILIDGFRMPQKKNGFVVVIYPDGVCACEDGGIFDAVELPPHGQPWVRVGPRRWKCPACGSVFESKVQPDWRYCPACGIDKQESRE